ncbi:cytochrome P450 [Actinomadura sp. DC4]|uniref:cytochrome P450 n=1 Tax=Actinomadura sp. DC4 TaxID=3055069 RepID=UPI0025AFC404|nr:cytochrome P450 [Actinomadura sp. DC4]MDN3353834.1 cytochrome P450 [Actinomadura sp. DC4]
MRNPDAMETLAAGLREPHAQLTRLMETTLARTVARGTRVLLLIGAANRDPAAFEDPERFDIGRAPTRHLAFGQGLHFCLGAPLARLEAQIVFHALARRAPRLGLAGEPDWKDTLLLRGPSRLPVFLR